MSVRSARPGTRPVMFVVSLALALSPGVAAQERGPPEGGPPAGDPPAAVPAPPPIEEPEQASDVPSDDSATAVATDPEKVFVRRLSDVVAVREVAKATERVLYYFNPNVELSQSDQLEQGSGAQSELVLPGGAQLLVYATGHVELTRLSAEGDVLRLPLLTRIDATALDRPLLLILPGGTEVRLQNGNVRVEAEPGRITVRNNGTGVVGVEGDLRLQRGDGENVTKGSLELQRGEEVIIPLFRVPGSELGTTADLWGAVAVRHRRGLTLLPDGDRLRVSRAGSDGALLEVDTGAQTPAPGTAAAVAAVEEFSVGGVTTKLLPGSALLIRNTHHVILPPAPETQEPGMLTPEEIEALEQLGTVGTTEQPIDGDDAGAAPEPVPEPSPAPPEADGGAETPPQDPPPPEPPESGTPKLPTAEDKETR